VVEESAADERPCVWRTRRATGAQSGDAAPTIPSAHGANTRCETRVTAFSTLLLRLPTRRLRQRRATRPNGQDNAQRRSREHDLHRRHLPRRRTAATAADLSQSGNAVSSADDADPTVRQQAGAQGRDLSIRRPNGARLQWGATAFARPKASEDSHRRSPDRRGGHCPVMTEMEKRL
jgi:hypothetical protein